MSWFSGLEAICQADAPLAELTWYSLGGPARWLLTPRDEPELSAVLRACAAAGVPWRVLGRGANVLVSDAGFPGAVIRLIGPTWEACTCEPPRVTAAAGADFTRVVKTCAERGLAGLEGLAGIPGSVGGVVRMNAGGKYGQVADCLEAARLMRPDGGVFTRPASELGLSYRHSELGGAIVLAATFRLRPADPAETLARFRSVWNEKHASQPPVSARSAGCIFKNPAGHAAGKLIDEAGLKGLRCGGAEVSTKHANFILAHPGARADDVLKLIELVRQRVHDATGVELETEVDLW